MMVLAFTDTTGAKYMLILLTLWHHPLRALCRSVEKNTYSLVKGMILFDQGGGEARGKKVMVERAPPRQSEARLFLLLFAQSIFSDVFAGSKILVGNSPAGPPTTTAAAVAITGCHQRPPLPRQLCHC